MIGGRGAGRLVTLAVWATAAGGLAACGVPTDTHPVNLAARDIPSGLIGTVATTTTLAGPKVPVSLVQVYFVAGDRLVPVGRAIPSPATLDRSLGSLLAGPTAKESAAGMRSAIGEGVAVLSARQFGAHAVIDLSASFADAGGPAQILAVGQLVFTATALPGVTSVSFLLADQPVAVPAQDGTLQAGAVTRAQYAGLLAPGG